MLALRLARFEHLVDIGRIRELQFVDRGDHSLSIGATVRQYEVEESAEIRAAVPLLAAATPLIGHFQIRSRGTVGGSIAHADPAAEYPAVALALDAEMEIAGPAGRRTVTAGEFFRSMWVTSVGDDELLTSVRFPIWGPNSGFALEEVARRHGDFAIAGAACSVQVESGAVTRAAIALFGMDGVPVRAADAERALVRTAVDEIDTVAVGHAAVAGLQPVDDLHASAQLRLRIGAAVTRRALVTALARATEGHS
jgi:carbon-monoxide dehydrogenase medium subunit